MVTHLRGQIFKTSLSGPSAAEACHQQWASPLGNPQVTKQEPSAELRDLSNYEPEAFTCKQVSKKASSPKLLQSKLASQALSKQHQRSAA